MNTIKGNKTREGSSFMQDANSAHNFIIFNEGNHAIDEEGSVWQVVDTIEEEEGVAYLTFEAGGYIFNYAEDGKAIEWMANNYMAYDMHYDVDWDKVKESLDDEDIFTLLQHAQDEEDFCKNMANKYHA